MAPIAARNTPASMATWLIAVMLVWPVLGCAARTPDVTPSEAGPDAASRAPHIVVLIADDLGIGYAPCVSAEPIMDNLESLCDSALVFTRVYTHPYCTPSRAAMMTGRHPFRTRSVDVSEDAFKLGLEQITIPEIIRAAGDPEYRFAAFGKWHLASDETGGVLNPNLQGFDHFEGTPRQHHTYRYRDYEWIVNGVLDEAGVETYKTTHIVDRAAAHFRANGSQAPWLYWVGFVSPHLPFHLPPRDLHSRHDLPEREFRSVWREPTGPDELRINRTAPQAVPYYQAMIEALDTEIARLVQDIVSSSDRPVIFVFLGDNGDAGEVAPNAQTGLRGTKAMVYEMGVRVPLMVWSSDPGWSERFAGRSDRLTHLADLFPTLAAIAAVPPDQFDYAPIDGRGFASEIWPGADEGEPHQAIYVQRGNPRAQPFALSAVSQGGHKLIIREQDRTVRYSDGFIEFFDLRADPGEANNLYPRLCGRHGRVALELLDYIEALHASEPASSVPLDFPEYRELIREAQADC